MTNETEFREEIEDAADIGVSPAEPSRFLRTLIETADTRAKAINEAVTEEIAEFTDGLIEHSQAVSDDLTGAEFGSFETQLPVLNYNYSWKIFAAGGPPGQVRRVASGGGGASVRRDDRIAAVFRAGTRAFQTLYVQWEITNISRGVLYGAMPALAAAGDMILEFDASKVAGTLFGVSTAYRVVSALYVLTLVPFAVLLAYLLRVLTVMKRTIAIGPFILRESEQLEGVRHDEPSEVQSEG